MSLSNRTELIPAWLFLLEFTAFLLISALSVLLGADLPILLACLLVLAYSLGADDVLALTRYQSDRAPYQAATITAGAYSAYVFVEDQTGIQGDLLRILVVLSILVLFVSVHRRLRTHLLGVAQRVTVTVPAPLRSQAEVLQHHLALSGYPGRVVVEEAAAVAAATVAIHNPRWQVHDDEVALVQPCDLVEFCDVSLRVLPPTILALDPQRIRDRSHSHPVYHALKRGADVLVAVIVLAATAPLWLFAMVGILLTDGRPFFYTQFRVGAGGKFFRIVKFRTLRPAESSVPCPTDDFATRVFRFGTFLRRSRIDELPQLLMVLRGTMSLVGPRPEMAFFHRRSIKTIPFYRYRLEAKPGLTGWAQIRYAHSTTEAEYFDKTAFDLWYVANRSIMVDAKIMLRTVGILLNRFGSK